MVPYLFVLLHVLRKRIFQRLDLLLVISPLLDEGLLVVQILRDRIPVLLIVEVLVIEPVQNDPFENLDIRLEIRPNCKELPRCGCSSAGGRP